ncbi:GNAT family N-acetyltransferase [Bradyrhizobium sp. CCBAU 51753]|uniref:GNAT family N-acetyltransferase n=1 Tax=Bradyrhizobium sp. CCBAU 51753 TaxID=1325100 RepID=UPI00188CC5B4|nr:hypothetical protein XH93_36265 [Bradyrhizobium sp. CCBAU 51753]
MSLGVLRFQARAHRPRDRFEGDFGLWPIATYCAAAPTWSLVSGRGHQSRHAARFIGTRPKSRLALLHTEVPQALSGQGYGSRLAHGVFEALRRDGKRVIAKCPFMSSYAARHLEYGALLDGRSKTDGRRRAQRFLDDDTSAYRMHDQR